MSSQIISSSSAAPDENHDNEHRIDPARQSLEPSRGANKKLVLGGMIAFILFLGLVFILVKFGKEKLHDYSENRDKKAAEQKAKNGENPSGRKAISFANSLAQKNPTEGKQNETAPIDLANKSNSANSAQGSQGTSGQGTQAIAVKQASVPPSIPSMMLDDGTPSKMLPGLASNPQGQIAGSGSAPTPDRRITPQELITTLEKSLARGQGNPPTQTATAPASTTSSAPPARTVQDIAEITKNKGLTNTKQVSAANLGNRDFVITRGHHMPCVLETQIMSNLPGTTACILTENIYSTNGRVLLLEKGTRAVGAYQSGLKVGDTRLAILWDRLESPQGIVVDVESPSADMVGASGVTGYVDNHWAERIGAAFLLSYVQDAIKYETAKASRVPLTEGNNQYGTTTTTSADLTKKVLDSTINIPPTMIKNRGDLINIEVRHDLWFQDVYMVKK